MIYLTHPDYQNYKSIVMDHKLVRKALGNETMFHFSRTPHRYLENWQAFEIGFASLVSSKKMSMPDLISRNGRLFLNAKAYNATHESLKKCGEFLPVIYDGKDGYLFNILTLAEEAGALDACLSTKNEFDEVQSIAFDEKKLNGINIFRCEFDGYMGIYCSNELKQVIETADLKGLTFSADLGNQFPKDEKAQTPENH